MIALRSGRKSAFSSLPSLVCSIAVPEAETASNSSEAPLLLPLFRPLFSSHYSLPSPPLLQADISGKLGFFAVSGIFRLSPRYIPPAAVSEREDERAHLALPLLLPCISLTLTNGQCNPTFHPGSEERRRVQTNYALTHMRCEGARARGWDISPSLPP